MERQLLADHRAADASRRRAAVLLGRQPRRDRDARGRSRENDGPAQHADRVFEVDAAGRIAAAAERLSDLHVRLRQRLLRRARFESRVRSASTRVGHRSTRAGGSNTLSSSHRVLPPSAVFVGTARRGSRRTAVGVDPRSLHAALPQASRAAGPGRPRSFVRPLDRALRGQRRRLPPRQHRDRRRRRTAVRVHERTRSDRVSRRRRGSAAPRPTSGEAGAGRDRQPAPFRGRAGGWRSTVSRGCRDRPDAVRAVPRQIGDRSPRLKAAGGPFQGRRERLRRKIFHSTSVHRTCMRKLILLSSTLTAFIALHAAFGVRAPLHAQPDGSTVINPIAFQELRWRSIGPHRGGRSTAAVGVRTQPNVFYMGATGGGVWKTENYGITWAPITDGQIATGSIGAIDVADSNPSIVYVGTGSEAIRSNVIVGRGVYKSTDAGRTWQSVGLKNVGQIGQLKIHPKDPDIAYVAALGNPFGWGPERGVYRTKDGGKTWQKVLFINDQTGAVSLAINWSNPNEIYAGAWRAQRKPWTIISGGPAAEGGVYKSTDGGDHWSRVGNGFPDDLIGKVWVDIAQSNPKVVYAQVEALR